MKDYNNNLYETVEAWLEAKTIQLSEMDMEEEDDGKALLQYTGALGALRSLEGRDLANRVEVLSRSLSDVASVLRNCEAMDDNNLDSSRLPEYLEHVLEESKGVFALGAICQMSKGLSAVAPDYLIPEDIARGMILERIEPIMRKDEEDEAKTKALRDAYLGELPVDISEDESEEELYKYACYMLSHGLSKWATLAELMRTNEGLCDCPLDDYEVHDIWQRALSSDQEEEEEEEKEKEWTLRDAYFADKPQMFHKGECYSGLYKYARFLLAHQTDEETILEEVTAVNKERCEKPLSEDKLKDIVASAVATGLGK